MITLVLCLVHCLSVVSSRRLGCRDNEFFNLETKHCQVCTLCKPGQAFRRTCSETNDTLCGMWDFSFLDTRKGMRQQYTTDYDEPFIQQEEHYTHRVTKVPTQKAPYVLSGNEEEWKNLAFALIGVLSVLVILATILVFVICYKVRHTGWFCKTVSGIDQGKLLFSSCYIVLYPF